MSALEQEIIEKFYQLDADSQERVLRRLQQPEREFDWDEWLSNIDKLQEEMRSRHGNLPPVDVVSLLREVREYED